MTALTINRFNGQLHPAIDHGEGRSDSIRLGTEAARIPLTHAESELGLDQIAALYSAGKLDWQKIERNAA